MNNRYSNDIVARLDRIPVWPYSWRVPVVIGAGFFFSFFDIVTIAFALPELTKQFSVSSAEASWAITSGLIGYIVGAISDGWIGDRYGRKLSLYLSVSAFSIGSLLAATSPDLDWLIFWRFISGMGIGAEIALVTTYMSEVSPAPLRGRYLGLTIATGFLAFAVVPFVALGLVPNFEWGWRAMFVIGSFGGVIILFMRHNLPDSPRWLLRQGRNDEAEVIVAQAERMAQQRLGAELPTVVPIMDSPQVSPQKLLEPPYIGRLVLLASAWFLYYVGNYAWLTLAPDLLTKEGFALKQSFSSLAFTGLGFVGGALTALSISDQIERKWLAAAVATCWGITLLSIGWYPSITMITVAGFIASYTIGLVIPILYTYTGENFPTNTRATAVALSDGLGHLGGAFCGQIVFAVYAKQGFTGAFTAMAVTGFLAAALLLCGIRTNGKTLDTL